MILRFMRWYNNLAHKYQNDIKMAQKEGEEMARLKGLKYCAKNWDKLLVKEIRRWQKFRANHESLSHLTDEDISRDARQSLSSMLLRVYGYERDHE